MAVRAGKCNKGFQMFCQMVKNLSVSVEVQGCRILCLSVEKTLNVNRPVSSFFTKK